MMLFLEENCIWISRLSKEIHPHQCWWAASNPLRVWIEQKAEEGQTPSCPSSAGTSSIFLCPGSLGLLVLSLQTLALKTSNPRLSGLQIWTKLSHWLSWVSRKSAGLFSVSISTGANPYNKSPLHMATSLFPYVYTNMLSLWRTLNNTPIPLRWTFISRFPNNKGTSKPKAEGNWCGKNQAEGGWGWEEVLKWKGQ